jgi:peptidyl-prolyl cis-trans isomerase C
MKKSLYFIILAFFVFVLIGCDREKGSDGPVLAKINKEKITQDDFLKEVSRVPEWAREQFKGKEGRGKFLDELIKRELIYQDAQKMRLDKDEEYVAKVKEFEKMTLVSLILKKEVEEKSKVDDAEVKAFFDQNQDKFRIGTEIKASHILVETEEEANNVLERINKGEKFSELAKSLSKDKASAQKGGDLGYFGRGKMVPEFERAAVALKPGEVSKPVRTRFGYHIIKLIDIKKGEPANFEQSKESIRRQLLAEKRKRLFDSYVNGLKDKSKVIKIDSALEELTLPWEQAEAPKPLPKEHPEIKKEQKEQAETK